MVTLVQAAIYSLGALVLIVYVLPRCWRARAVARLRRLCRRERLLVLTYDDGPGASLTPSILELLADHGALGTFFVKGSSAEWGTDLLDQVAAAGHEIGCHSQEHTNAWKVLPSRAWRDARDGFASLSRWVAADGLYRPPHGKLDLFTWARLSSRGVRQGWWTLDSGDTWPGLPSIDDVVERVKASGGGVVLMHDMDRCPERERFVVELTERLLKLADSEQLTCRPLGALLARAES